LYCRRLHLKKELADKDPVSVKFTPDEDKYFTNLKMRINYSKHFLEDNKFQGDYELPYKTLRYVRKLKMRNNCSEMKP
jgi:hypothetical protein